MYVLCITVPMHHNMMITPTIVIGYLGCHSLSMVHVVAISIYIYRHVGVRQPQSIYIVTLNI